MNFNILRDTSIARVAVLLIILTSSTSFARSRFGGSDGGGGIGVLCGVKNLRVLDLYEADEIDKLPPGKSRGSFEETLVFYGARLANTYAEKYFDPDNSDNKKNILAEYKEIESRFRFIPKGERLRPTNDASIPTLKKGCRLVQIASIQSEFEIKIDREYWNMLDDLNKVALISHEHVYSLAIFYDMAITSDRSRKLIGHVFSSKKYEFPLENIWGADEKLICVGGGADPDQNDDSAEPHYEIHIVDTLMNGELGVEMYFTLFNGLHAISRMSHFFAGTTIRELKNGPREVILAATIKDSVTDEVWRFEFDKRNGPKYRAWKKGAAPPNPSHGFCLLTFK